MRTIRTVLAAMASLTSFAAAANAQDDPAPAATATDPLVEKVEKAFDRYPIKSVDGSQAFKPLTVLKWKNNPRGQEGIAIFVLWTRDGVPMAQVSVYPWEGRIVHELGALAGADSIAAWDGNQSIWRPATDGVTFMDVPEAPAPAASAIARLRQMKSIAEQFEATMTGWRGDNADREELRLMPRELYRYDEQELAKSSSGIRDGAVFAFAQGTDPEAVLYLQAAGDGNNAKWQYAFARATSGGLEARLDSSVVWTAEKNYTWNDPSAPQFSQGELLVE